MPGLIRPEQPPQEGRDYCRGLRAAGFACEREVAIQPGSLQRPGDLRTIGFDRGVSVDADASVVLPLQLSASSTPEDVTAAVVRQGALKMQHSLELCNRAGVQLALAVVATTGGWSASTINTRASLRALWRA